MVRPNTWKPGYAAMATAIVVPLLALIFSYRPAVNWFNAVNNVKASEAAPDAPPTLPVTGLKPVPENPGFPWWAVVVITAAIFSVLFLWLSGYKNVLAVSSHATAHAAERRARSYTFDADIYQHLDEEKGARRLRGLAGRLGRTALALKGTSQFLNRLESAGTKLDLPPVGTDELSSGSIDTEQYQGMPPRLDSLHDDSSME